MSVIFLIAARKKFRYASSKGDLTTEQLFDLPLTSTRGVDLDTTARGLSRQLREMTEESFVETRSNPLKAELTTKLEVVKEIIAIKQTENAAAADARAKEVRRQRLLAALDEAEGKELSAKGVEDLRKELQELDKA